MRQEALRWEPPPPLADFALERERGRFILPDARVIVNFTAFDPVKFIANEAGMLMDVTKLTFILHLNAI